MKKITEEQMIDTFNQGREHCDRKWLDEIDKRIKELEIKYGITELKRFRDKTKYLWKSDKIVNLKIIESTHKTGEKK